ncbi:MAG: alanine racemase [Candidatus Dormibacteria bacterium]
MAATSVAVPVPGTRWAEVDAAALRDNVRALRAAAPAAELMAMVKANGYGHGALTVARAAVQGGARWIGVSSVTEALEVATAGLQARILNVGWSRPSELPLAASKGVHVAVWDVEGVEAARHGAKEAGRRLHVHWKLDTGMGRLGTRPEDVRAVAAALRQAREEVTVAAIFTHLAAADAPGSAFTEAQEERFGTTVAAVRDSFPDALLHSANSAALLRFPPSHHDVVRPGIAVYGYAPVATPVALRPAMALRALVTQTKRIEAGESVGYGREWIAPRPSLIAHVALGYGDGVDRRNAANGALIAGGALCPIRGRISMDQLAIDVSEAGPVRSGDVATLIGADAGLRIDAGDVAARIGTIAYEVLCAVGARVPRVVINEEVSG